MVAQASDEIPDVLPERMAIAQVELLQNKLFLVANPQVKVARNHSAYSLFEQLPLIYREAGSGTRQSMERFLYFECHFILICIIFHSSTFEKITKSFQS